MYKNNFFKSIFLSVVIISVFFTVYLILFFPSVYNKALVKLTINNPAIFSKYLEKEIIPVCISKGSLSPDFFKKYSQVIQKMARDLDVQRLTIVSDKGKVIFSYDKNKNNIDINYSHLLYKKSNIKILSFQDNKIQHFGNNLSIFEEYIPIKKENIFIGAFYVYSDIGLQKQQLNHILVSFFIFIIPIILCLAILIVLFAYKASRNMKEALHIETESDKFKNEFIGSVTHEFRNPLTSIAGFAEMGIKRIDTVPKETLKRYFYLINSATNQLIPLINDILDLSKLRAGKMTYSMKYQDILEPIQYIASELTCLLDKKHLKLNIINNNIKTTSFFDSRRIIQVLRNLLSNAIKFSPENEEIIIRVNKKTISNKAFSFTSRDLESLVISIENNGPRINEEDLTHIFQPFFQSKFRRMQGTGLGLSIANRIITAHRGLIFAENKEDNKGMIFYFSIPIKHPIG